MSVRILLIAAFLLTGAGLARAEDDKAMAAEVRKAVERGLPFLKAEGLTWIRGNKCLSCHQAPLGIWGLNEAHRHGLFPDRDELVRWNQWALDFGVERAVFYALSDQTLAALAKADLPEDELAALRPIKQTFVTREDLRQELAKVLAAETLTRHEEAIFKSAAKPGQGDNGSGSDTPPAELILAGTPSLTGAPAEAANALAERLVITQEKDGSWKVGVQFHGQKRPVQESNEVNTQWNLLALTSLEAPSDQAARSRGRARAWLAGRKPGVSTESLVTHLLVAHQLKETERAGGLLKELLGQQHPDGGWGWQRRSDESDAFATGQVLYALGTLAKDGSDPSIQRAWTYLVKTQRADGTWLVPSAAVSNNAKASKDRIYSYWGTGWAVIGLLRTLPE
jgi:hypothetical protein